MRCFETGGDIRNMRFGQATVGWIFERIEISIGELRVMDDKYMWDYISLRLLTRLVPGGTLTIVNGTLEEIDIIEMKPSDDGELLEMEN